MNGIGSLGASGLGGAGGIQQILALRQQLVDRSQVLRQIHAPEAGGVAQAETGPTSTFATTLKSALDGVTATQNRAEALTVGYERGEVTDIAKVMLARQEAGVAFEATLQTRNKLLSAYQDIMRMGV